MNNAQNSILAVIIGVFLIAVGYSTISDSVATGIVIVAVGVATISLSLLYYLFVGRKWTS